MMPSSLVRSPVDGLGIGSSAADATIMHLMEEDGVVSVAVSDIGHVSAMAMAVASSLVVGLAFSRAAEEASYSGGASMGFASRAWSPLWP